jgi:hypothetical protein
MQGLSEKEWKRMVELQRAYNELMIYKMGKELLRILIDGYSTMLVDGSSIQMKKEDIPPAE